MQSKAPLPIRLLTHNIRYATSSPSEGEELWSVRRKPLINELIFYTRYNSEAIVCLQEVLHQQLVDIMNGMNDAAGQQSWAYIGVGREDGHRTGEYSPILYRPEVWELEHQETIWLSKTPDKPSKGWDAASTRILTRGLFQHKANPGRIIAMNTHLDDQGSESRYEAAKIIVGIINKVSTIHVGSRTKYLPVVLAGDFNSAAGEEAHQVITGEDSRMSDLVLMTDSSKSYGNRETFTGFGHEEEPPKRIDFLFLSRNVTDSYGNLQPSWKVKGYAGLSNRFEDGIYCSDHRAIVGDVELI